MQLEFHQLDRRWEHLRVREPHPLDAGTAFRQAEARPVAEVVERLVSGLRR